MSDDDHVLVDAPPGATLLGAALSIHEIDRLRIAADRTAVAWARCSVRLGDPGYDADDVRAALCSRLPGVSILVGVTEPQHGRAWELDVLPVYGPPLLLLGPRLVA